MRTVLGKSCIQNQNTHFMFSNVFSENQAVYEIMSKKFVKPGGGAINDVTIWLIHVEFRISKATRTHAQTNM
jgi:hypothetical protein